MGIEKLYTLVRKRVRDWRTGRQSSFRIADLHCMISNYLQLSLIRGGVCIFDSVLTQITK